MAVAAARIVTRAFAIALFAGAISASLVTTAPRSSRAAGPGDRAEMPTSADGVDLAWDAPTPCPSAGDVRSAIAQLTGARASADANGDGAHAGGPPRLRVRGRVRARRDGVFRVALEIDDGDVRAERDVVAPTCALATEAATVVIAMLLTHDSAAASPPPPAPPPPAEAPLVAPAPAHDVAIGATPRARRSIALGLGGTADSATLPSVTPGIAASIGWRSRSAYRLRAELGATPTSHARGRVTADDRTLGGDVQLFRAGVRGEMDLVESAAGGTAFGFTAGVDAGVLHATGTGANTPATNDAFWLALCAGPRAHVPFGDRLALRGAVELVVPLVRPTLLIDADPIHRPAAAGARATISAEIAF